MPRRGDPEADYIGVFVDEMVAVERYLLGSAEETLSIIASSDSTEVRIPSTGAPRKGAAIVALVGAEQVIAQHRRLRSLKANLTNS